MKAIHLTVYGNPAQNLQMVEVPEPNAPSTGEALVRMEYAPVDYSDLLLANGVYFLNPQLPSVIGGEGAGIVEAIGPGCGEVGRHGLRHPARLALAALALAVQRDQQRRPAAARRARRSEPAARLRRERDADLARRGGRLAHSSR